MSNDKTIIADGSNLTLFKPAKRLVACLVQYNGTNLGKRFQINKPNIIIGRSPDADIVINEQSVSRQHSKCSNEGEKIFIQDMGSSNGTYVNNDKAESKTLLKDGDIIRLGTVLLKYFSENNIDNLINDKIYRMATIDAGTGIFNKKHLIESIESEFLFSRSSGKELSIIYFDLDFFKKVNDTYGHNAGDFILREVATIVSKLLRKDDIFCRFGGEEFVILLPNSGARVAYDLAEHIRKTLESHTFSFENHQLKQTVSLGVSQLHSSMTKAGSLLDDADKKLYHSKKNGRNQVTI